MDIIQQHGTLFLALAVIFGLYMTWGIGANDVANVMGTSVGSGAITVRTAIIIAAVFEFAGAALAGGHVTDTIRKGMIDADAVTGSPEILVFGMLSALLAAGIWLMVASTRGWPVSTTHSIVGAVVGFAVAALGMEAVNWGKIGQIVASWVVSPVLGGAIAFVLMMSIRKLILNTENPFASAKRWGPVYVFLVGFIIALVTLFKGLKPLKIDLSVPASFLLAAVIGLIIAAIGYLLIQKVKVDEEADKDFHYASVEKVFVPMMLFTACGMAFAHGSNDVANGVGPMAAVVGLVNSGGEVAQKSESADLDPGAWWHRHRRRPCDLRLSGDADDRLEDYRADTDPRFLRDHGGGGDRRSGLAHRHAGLDYPHRRGRGDRCRHGAGHRCDRP